MKHLRQMSPTLDERLNELYKTDEELLLAHTKAVEATELGDSKLANEVFFMQRFDPEDYLKNGYENQLLWSRINLLG